MRITRRSPLLAALLLPLMLAVAACDDGSTHAPQPPPPQDETPVQPTPPDDKEPDDEPEQPAGPLTLDIDLSSAVGLAVKSALGTSTVYAVTADARLEALTASGETFYDFRIVDGRVFLSPYEAWRYGCWLLMVNADMALECVDPDMRRFEAIIINPDGGVSYLASDGSSGNRLRVRSPDGNITDVFDATGPIGIDSWSVASDGRVFLTGSSGSPREYWVRRVNDDGTLTTFTLDTPEPYYYLPMRLLGVWPDGNVYLYAGGHAFWRIPPDTGEIDSVPHAASQRYHPDAPYYTDGVQLSITGYDAYDLQRVGHRIIAVSSTGGSVELYPRFEDLKHVPVIAARNPTRRGHILYAAGRTPEGPQGIGKNDTATGDSGIIYRTDLEIERFIITPDAGTAIIAAYDPAHNQRLLAKANLNTGSTTTEAFEGNILKLESLE